MKSQYASPRCTPIRGTRIGIDGSRLQFVRLTFHGIRPNGSQMLPADIPPLPPLPAGIVLTMPEPVKPRSSAQALRSTASLNADDRLPHSVTLPSRGRSVAATSVPRYGAIAERVSLRAGHGGSAEQDLQPPPLPADLMNPNGASAPQARERSFKAWIAECVPHPGSGSNSDSGSASDNAWAELDDIAGYQAGVADELQRDNEAPRPIADGPSPPSWATSFLSMLKQKGRRALAHGLADVYAGLQELGSALRDFMQERFS